MEPETRNLIIAVMAFAGIITVIAGLSMSFVLVPTDDPILDPGTTTNPSDDPIDPITIIDTSSPTITVNLDGKQLSSSELLVTENFGEIEIIVVDTYLINVYNTKNSYVEFRISRIDDDIGTLMQLQYGRFEGETMKDKCSVLNGEYYTRFVFRYDISGLKLGSKYIVSVESVDYAENLARTNNLEFRYFAPPGELSVQSWIPREERYLDFIISLETDILVKSVDAYFTDADGTLMKDISSGELFTITCTKVYDYWEFTWDTKIFPNGEYSVKCRVRYGETALTSESYKYEKFYSTGVAFKIVNDATNSPSVETAPGFGIVVVVAGLMVINIILITKYHGDDNNKKRKIKI